MYPAFTFWLFCVSCFHSLVIFVLARCSSIGPFSFAYALQPSSSTSTLSAHFLHAFRYIHCQPCLGQGRRWGYCAAASLSDSHAVNPAGSGEGRRWRQRMAISEPQNRIRGPPRHTSPDTMQPVKIEHLPLVRIRHTERSILNCRRKSAPVPGRVIPFLVLSPACLLFTDQLIGAARGKFFPAYRAYPYLTRLFRLFSELAYTFGAFLFFSYLAARR